MTRVHLVVVAAAIGAVLAPSAASAAPCKAAPRSWTGGFVNLCRGNLVYLDYVDDDYGADTGGTNTTSGRAGRAPSAGEQEYPGSGQDATADIVRLTLSVKGRRLRVSGLMDALFSKGQTTLALAIDTDGKSSHGGGKWKTLDASSKGWDKLYLFKRGNTKTTTMTGNVRL